MFLQKRVINGITYTYLDHSFRIGNEVKKVSLILDKNKQDYNEAIIEKIAAARAAYFTKNFQTYFSEEEMTKIETEKIFYQIFFNSLDRKFQEAIWEEYLRLFLANSMELEGSTITPQLAENIDKRKRTILPEAEVKLYHNSKGAFKEIIGSELRSVIQFKQFHQMIYEGIIPDAGNFKKLPNTFGYTEKARTAPPEKVRLELKKTLENYQNKEIYPFLKPLLFHLNYQKTHPFTDGNSRLGRILLVAQMCKLNYPALIFKGDLGFQIRETLMEYINRNHLDFCRLCLEQYLLTSIKFWRPMIRKYLY
ncbi:MAG TPA: Fic family protein [Candidatus Nanoarchaeia archaeon]|nr:Fic family protein [Candidatus Nanoarchaeia archaeon]